MVLRALAGVSVCSIYRVIQKGSYIFWGVIELVVLEKAGTYEHVSNSEWLTR